MTSEGEAPGGPARVRHKIFILCEDRYDFPLETSASALTAQNKTPQTPVRVMGRSLSSPPPELLKTNVTLPPNQVNGTGVPSAGTIGPAPETTFPKSPLEQSDALPGFQFTLPPAVSSIVAVAVRRRNQPAGPTHRGSVIRVDGATDEAYLVGLVGMPVYPGMRPGKAMPAAHFEKPLKNWSGHEVLISPKSFPSYSAGRAHGISLLAIASGIMATPWSHYLVTEGGGYVTVPPRLPGRTTGTGLPEEFALP